MKKTVFAVLITAISLVHASALPASREMTREEKILHLINRITFGPRPGEMDRVRKIGFDSYLDEQLHPERIDDKAVDAILNTFPSLRMDTATINERYVAPNQLQRELGLVKPGNADANQDQNPDNNLQLRAKIQAYYEEHGIYPPQKLLQELQAQKIIRAVSSARQLQEVMTDFWYNHFNIYWGKGSDRQLTTDYEVNAIRPHVLGKFKDLVMATAKSPAMLFYLDNAQSSSPDSRNPAMERLEQLQRQQVILRNNPRAQERLQQQIMEIQERIAEAKTQNTRKRGINENYARELMELHTMGVDGGYTQKDVQEVARAFTGWTIDRPRQGAGFIFREGIHDQGEKIVLGHKINAGGMKDGEEVIDILMHHPSTARFIATKLVRRFVSDEPPVSLVDRVAATYMKTDGDIREMLRAIFTSSEFNSPEAYRAKTKSPFELAVSSIRALDGTTNGAPRLAQEIGRMGQPLYQCQPPTGYPDRASQWMSSGSLVERLNFEVALSANRIPGTSVDLTRLSNSSRGPEDAVQNAVQILLGGDVSEQTKRILLDQVGASDEPVIKAFALVLGSPEFQKR